MTKMEIYKLAGFTCDGASVMTSPKEGKLRRETNPKLFSTHCPPHRLVLPSKEGERERSPVKLRKHCLTHYFSSRIAPSGEMNLEN